MKPCVKFKSVCKIDIGVIAPYLILYFFSFNQYVSKNSYLKNIDIKILCKYLYFIFVKVSTLIRTKKNHEKVLKHRNMAVEMLLLIIVFC